MKKRYECFNKIIQINFNAIEKSSIEKIDFWIKKFTPSVVETNSKKYDLEVYLNNSNSYKVIEKSKCIFIKGKILNNEGTIGKYISQVFQKLLINEEIIFIHASCVAKGNKGIIIIGDFASGKSSIAIGCKNADSKIKIVSDNGIAISKNYILGGTNSISLRVCNKAVLKNVNQNSKFNYTNRVYFNFDSEFSGPIDIKKIIIPHINKEDNNIYEIDYQNSLWYLYGKFSQLIKGETVLFTDKIPTSTRVKSSELNIILNEVKYLLSKNSARYVSCEYKKIIESIIGELNE